MKQLQLLRRIATSCPALQQGPGASPGAQLNIFDGILKAAQRDRAAHYPAKPDPLADEVADRLVDRLEDCTRDFPNALVLGGAGLQVLRLLNRGRGGVKSATLVDTSLGMLERAQREFNNSSGNSETAAGEAKGGYSSDSDEKTLDVEYILADPEKELLPVDPGSFDVVISCLGLHWVNDVPGMMAQCRFALRPDGLFLGAMLGGNTVQELRIACTLAQQEREGGVAPRTSPLAQVRDAGNLLTRAGLAIPTVDVDEIVVQYPDVLGLVNHLRKMGEGNALKQRRESLPRDTALAAAAVYTSLFGEEVEFHGKSEFGVPASFEIVYMTGWAPDPSQPRAAKRGSGTVSFEDLSSEIAKTNGK